MVKGKIMGNAVTASRVKIGKKSNIALIGFMCAGKTSVGRLLAASLGKKFIDTDNVIEKTAYKTISEIFDSEGEIGFRAKAIEAVKKASEARDAVISCGGGVVYNKINTDRLKTSSYIVFLKVSPKAVLERAERDGIDRPLLRGKGKMAAIKKLIALREPLYTAYSDLTVDTTNAGIGEAAKAVISKIKNQVTR